MAGHSHWKSIKRVKEAEDKKRGQIFSKISRQITLAAKEGGPDPKFNSKLKLALELARSFNFPKDHIERAIKRGATDLGGEGMEEILYEALGPGGVAILIEGIADNKNRALAEIKQVLTKNQGKPVKSGSVKWLFERKGVITIDLKEKAQINKERIGLAAIEAGAQDLGFKNETLEVRTKIEDLEKVRKALENQGIEIESASLDWVPKEYISVAENERVAAKKLFEELDSLDSVQEIYSNLKI